MNKLDEPNSGNEGNRRGAVVALLAVAFLGICGYLLAHELSASARLQDCVLSGRTNCVPIESTH